jgi:hypothetical protein
MLIQTDLDSIAQWSALHKLPLNILKSMFTFTMSKKWTSCRYKKIGRTVIAKVENQMDLGIVCTINLSYSQHINELYNKVNRLTGMTLHAFECRSSPFMLMLWSVYLRPKLEYAAQVWNGSYNASCLESIQRKFTKKINGFHNLS